MGRGDFAEADVSKNLLEKIAGYKEALRLHTQKDSPQQWAETQYNLADTYTLLADAEEDFIYLFRAHDCLIHAAKGFSAVGLADRLQAAKAEIERIERKIMEE